jgi:hypothetical protein
MNGFFRFLWRVNAVLAFVAVVAALGYIGVLSKDRIKWPIERNFEPPPVEPRPSPTYVLEPDLVVGGSSESRPYNLFRLVRWDKVKKNTPGAPSAVVNILVIDKETNANYWLFKGVNRIIVAQEPVLTGKWAHDNPDVDEPAPFHSLVFRVIDGDAGKDGGVGGVVRQSLYVSRFDGNEPEKILTADQIWYTDQNGKDYFVSYRNGGVGYFATYSVPDFKLVTQTQIQNVPK